MDDTTVFYIEVKVGHLLVGGIVENSQIINAASFRIESNGEVGQTTLVDPAKS